MVDMNEFYNNLQQQLWKIKKNVFLILLFKSSTTDGAYVNKTGIKSDDFA